MKRYMWIAGQVGKDELGTIIDTKVHDSNGLPRLIAAARRDYADFICDHLNSVTHGSRPGEAASTKRVAAKRTKATNKK